jgi:hypothetical protein
MREDSRVYRRNEALRAEQLAGLSRSRRTEFDPLPPVVSVRCWAWQLSGLEI